MQSFTSILAAAGLITVASAQSYTPTQVNGTSLYNCPGGGAGSWCLAGPLIVTCNSTGQGYAQMCQNVLDRINNGENATCYNPTPTEGNAACAIDGIVYASSSTYSEAGYFPTSSPASSSSSSASAALTSPTMLPGGNSFACPAQGGNYCANNGTIIYCDDSTGMGQGHLCETILGNRDNGANAYCYDPMAGDGRAICAISGVAYGPSVTAVIVPGATIIPTTPVGGSAPSSSPATTAPPMSTSSMVGVPVSELSDGQPQVTSTVILPGGAAHAGVGLAAALGALAFAL